MTALATLKPHLARRTGVSRLLQIEPSFEPRGTLVETLSDGKRISL